MGIEWNTSEEDMPDDTFMALVTLEREDGSRYIDYIQYYRGEWCSDNEVIAWAVIQPYRSDGIKEIAYQAIRAYELGAKLGIQSPIA